MNIRTFFPILAIVAASAGGNAAVNVQQQANGQYYTGVVVNGGSNSKYDIVFIGDGFRDVDQAAFNTAVNAAVTALQNRPGYAERMCGFNIWRVNVISSDQGVDHPKEGIVKNTELDCRYGNPAVGEAERCVVTNSPAKCFEAAAYAPGRDATFVLVNDTQWGGCAGSVVCSSIAPGFAGIITHELGHKLSDLADEYDCYVCDGSDANRTYTGGEPGQVNVTANTDRATTKWHQLIAATTAIPTVTDVPPGVVGLWEGGQYYRRGIYRPQSTCHMRTTGSEFCAVCAGKISADLASRCPRWWDLFRYRKYLIREPFRFPIPVCLSCPNPWLREPMVVRLKGLPRGTSVRIVDTHGEVVASAMSGENGVNLEFESSRAQYYFAEVTPGQGAEAREVTLEAEISRNGRIQELPALREN